ncbi:MAG: hypothetical protein B0W54_02160 [Cellvibrio sp. 79]|nr:MAG: hypothetical protein B0W54_02160 [Cellvibrio sp. 79]
MNIDRFSPLIQRSTLLLSLLAGSLVLTACGGGSDNKSSASSSSSSVSSSIRSSFSSASVPANGSGDWPSVKVEAQNPKQLTFQWSAVDGATYYKLFKHDKAVGGVTQVGGNLTTTQATDEIGVHVHDWVNNYYYVEACDAADVCSEKSDLTFTATEMIKAIGYLKASNGESFDSFGWSIAISADGKTLAVGAPAEDSKAVGANGDQTNNDSTNAGAVYIFVKENGIWVQEAYLKASNTEQPNLNSNRVLPNDRFGYKVALSDDGNTLAVSALLEDSISNGVNCNQDNYEQRIYNSSDPAQSVFAAVENNTGAVYVFTRANKEWTQDAYVKSVTYFKELRFGETLALSGDGKTLAIGATSDSLAMSGVIAYQASSQPECIVYYPSSSSSSVSSSSVSSSSISSSSASSVSSTSSYKGGTASGAVQILVRKENGWMQQALLKNSNAEQGDAFGTSIALSTDGNTIVVGAIGEDSQAKGINGNQADNSCYYPDGDQYVLDLACEDAYFERYGINNGAAYVFTRANNIWTQEAYLKPATTFFNTLFGSSVDISGDGNTLVVGANGDTTDSVDTSNRDTIDKTKVQEVAKQVGSGSAYVFGRSGTTWSQQAYLKPSTITLAGEFGGDVSVSHDGNTIAVGSYREASNSKGINGDQGDASAESAGAVFVFTRTNSVWTQQSYVKASNAEKNDRFGLSVDLSGDGKTLAVGAHRESGRGYSSASSTSSQSSSSTSSLADGELDQNDNSAEVSGAVYLF